MLVNLGHHFVADFDHDAATTAMGNPPNGNSLCCPKRILQLFSRLAHTSCARSAAGSSNTSKYAVPVYPHSGPRYFHGHAFCTTCPRGSITPVTSQLAVSSKWT